LVPLVLASGAPYTVIINEKFTFPGPEFSDLFRMRVISRGSEQNLIVRIAFRDGRYTMDTTECVG
jgi:hypothetical protein